MAGVLTGGSASFYISAQGEGEGGSQTVYGLSDISITFDRDTVEQELVGQTGNYFDYGALSVDGSFTCCKFASSGNADALRSIVKKKECYISMQIGSAAGDLKIYFTSAMITGWSISIGDASTITEASIDFTVLDPYNVVYDSGVIHD